MQYLISFLTKKKSLILSVGVILIIHNIINNNYTSCSLYIYLIKPRVVKKP